MKWKPGDQGARSGSAAERSAGRRREHTAEGPADTRARDRAAAKPRPSAAPAPAPAAVAERAAWTLAAVLAALALARGALAFAPSMWLWGLNVLAFVDPLPGWALWALGTLALVPALARRVVPALDRAGDTIADRPALAGAALGAVLAITVLALPDRIHLVGDYLLRLGTASGQIPTDTVFPQALPLDLAFHYTVPSVVARALGTDPNDVSRAIGAIEAALFGALAVAFARVLRLRGAGALAAAAVAAFGGALGMFTGFAKVFGELCLVTAAFAVLGTSAVRDGRGLTALSVAVCLGLALHRSALAFLPPLLLVWALWFRAHGAGGAWRRPGVLAAAALPAITLAIMLPRIRAAIASTDRLHFARAGSDLQHVLGAAFRPGHIADLGNLLLLLSPLVLGGASAAVLLGPSLRRRPEAVVLLALLVPLAGLMLFVHPRQGPFRDWDVFAAAGVAVSLATAWLAGEILRASPRHAWLAAAVTLGTFAPAVQWLMHNHDAIRGLARVEAYLVGPPLRGDEERALLHSFLGLRYEAFGQLDAAAEALARAAALAPSPLILTQWSMAESARGNFAAAQRILQGLALRAPDMINAWAALAQVSYQLGDTAECRRAAESALRIRPDLPQARDLLNRLARREEANAAPAR
jgi:tetratricopeptide (TPR) repeat protein